MSHAASAPALPGPAAAQSSLSGGMASGHHSRTPSGSSAMSAPSAAASVPTLPAAGASSGGRPPPRKPQSKAEMNAHILSLYSRPSSSQGAAPGMRPQQPGGASAPQLPGPGALLQHPLLLPSVVIVLWHVCAPTPAPAKHPLWNAHTSCNSTRGYAAAALLNPQWHEVLSTLLDSPPPLVTCTHTETHSARWRGAFEQRHASAVPVACVCRLAGVVHEEPLGCHA